MADSAFIEVETDFEYVRGGLNEMAARFLMDFYHVSGDLEYTLHELANMMHDTAVEYLRMQIDPQNSTGNLERGIVAKVRGRAIELRSTAYRLPLWGKEEEGGQHTRMRKYRGVMPREYKGYGRTQGYRGYAATESAKNMIMPQKVDWVGATGGHHSLRVRDITTLVEEGDTSKREKVGHDSSHKLRYNRTKNIQYYGAHVEFGHKTRDGGGIGFVQARPHLRPALRTVADASTGYLSQTMASMLFGSGNRFNAIMHQGRYVQGLRFGNVNVSQADLNKVVGAIGGSQHRMNQFREAYSVRGSRRGFGRIADSTFRRYGYHEKTMEISRSQQRMSKLFNPDHNKSSKGYVKASEIAKDAHKGTRYKFPSTLKKKPIKQAKTAATKQTYKPRKTRSDKGTKRQSFRGRSYSERHKERAKRKIQIKIYGKTRNKDIPKNFRGKDKTRLTQPQDFDYKGHPNYVIKPTRKYKNYLPKDEYEAWQNKYEEYWDILVDQAKAHNKEFDQGLDDIYDN